ncbi:predicted protein [Sclerotinia sclerotiorum 1980 UF-70]|uniref:Uncharacterized protein n=1 Tax=Sclerotinia sclerotiorum (strain ATCC 18683 / 1980 / Ss-1) TaxID=665079 RepID=A7EIU7_SCLS1|nr:predicted protein [Sclerotinia sclerotiorum 1980 UF-70]EDO02763.1 predicted protein [Sclerotinia sclerotiorum 1980 UF-70]
MAKLDNFLQALKGFIVCSVPEVSTEVSHVCLYYSTVSILGAVAIFYEVHEYLAENLDNSVVKATARADERGKFHVLQ